MRHLYVLVGGAAGALGRWGLSFVLWPGARIPVGILTINLLGAFLLGYLTAFSMEAEMDPDLRIGLGTGVLGAFTTFSTWQQGVFVLGRAGDWVDGVLYLGGSLVGGLLAAALGIALARRQAE